MNLESFFHFIHNAQYNSRTTTKTMSQQKKRRKKWGKIYYNEYINEAIFIHFFASFEYFWLNLQFFVPWEFVVFLEVLSFDRVLFSAIKVKIISNIYFIQTNERLERATLQFVQFAALVFFRLSLSSLFFIFLFRVASK